MATKNIFLFYYILSLLLFQTIGCASPVKENIRIQPPPANNIELLEDGKKIGSLTGTTDIKGTTYYIFNVTEPFCFKYAPQIKRPELPQELNQFRDSYNLVKKDAGTFCATGNIIFLFNPQTKTIDYLIPQNKIDRVMGVQ
jgi:hypothetical protein